MAGDLEQQAKIIERQVNEQLAKAGRYADPAQFVPAGWEYVDATYVGGPPRIVITRMGGGTEKV